MESSKSDIERVRDRLFLNQYDPRNGEYRGDDPPRKSEVVGMSPVSKEWSDEWINSTGDFMFKEDGLIKYVHCQCGHKPWSGPRARHIRCRECSRVHVDLEWEDDRYENPNNKKHKGLKEFM